MEDLFDIPIESMSCQMRATIAVKHIKDLIELGCNVPTIVAVLNSKGIKSTHGKPFTKMNVYKIINRWKFGKPTYDNVLTETK